MNLVFFRKFQTSPHHSELNKTTEDKLITPNNSQSLVSCEIKLKVLHSYQKNGDKKFMFRSELNIA